MTEEQEERLVTAIEKIGTALMGIYDTKEKQYAKLWPEKKEVHDAIYSRVPSEEDLIREKHGASDESTEDWLTLSEEEQCIGRREREFLQARAAVASAQAGGESKSKRRSAKASQN